MNFIFQDNCENIPWEKVPLLLQKVDMSFSTPDTHRISFESSYAVIFVFDGKELIGFGRIISDGVRQSAVYDIAIEPSYQGKGIGKEIMTRLTQATPECNFILYASPGKELFYKKLGFKKMKTGMAFFANLQRMTDDVFVEND